MAPRTISDLGADASRQHAAMTQLAESQKPWLHDSRMISAHVQIDQLIPTLSHSMEALGLRAGGRSWASFPAPPLWGQTQYGVFGFTLGRHLGDAAALELALERVHEISPGEGIASKVNAEQHAAVLKGVQALADGAILQEEVKLLLTDLMKG